MKKCPFCFQDISKEIEESFEKTLNECIEKGTDIIIDEPIKPMTGKGITNRDSYMGKAFTVGENAIFVFRCKDENSALNLIEEFASG